MNETYDFITCTEVIEHFHHPASEFQRLGRMLAPVRRLGLMICFQTEDSRLELWHYRRDPTHVVFYREETLRQIAIRQGWIFENPCKDVALMGRR